MSDIIKNVEGIVFLGLTGFGLFLAYNMSQDKGVTEGVGKLAEGIGGIAETANVVLSTGADLFASDVTYGEGERCVNNPECSATGIAGGVSVGADLLGNQEFGCCSGRCKKKNIGILGNTTCADTSRQIVDNIVSQNIEAAESHIVVISDDYHTDVIAGGLSSTDTTYNEYETPKDRFEGTYVSTKIF